MFNKEKMNIITLTAALIIVAIMFIGNCGFLYYNLEDRKDIGEQAHGGVVSCAEASSKIVHNMNALLENAVIKTMLDENKKETAEEKAKDPNDIVQLNPNSS